MSRAVEFIVEGTPVPQGSKTLGQTKGGQAFMRESNATEVRRWRRAIKAEAEAHRVTWIKQVPLAVELVFVMPMTKDRVSGWCPVKPDIDKLTRAVLDGCKDGGVLVDDSQVVALRVAKLVGAVPRVAVRITDAPPPYAAATFVSTTQELPDHA